MTPIIRFQNVSYIYPLQETAALQDFSMDIECGEMILVVGESGSGKSTLLRAINGLVPHFYGGSFQGAISVDGLNTLESEPRDLSASVGFVFQDPETQFVADIVEDEMVFAMENFGLPPVTMRLRVEELLDQMGISHLRRRRISTLSGGEKQRVAIASVLTLRPRILVLDEPTSQLDPLAAEEVLGALDRLNTDLGLTIVLAEHRLERVVQYVDRVLWLPGNGARAVAGTTRTMMRSIPLVPPVVELGRRLGWEPVPLTVKEARRHATDLALQPGISRTGQAASLEHHQERTAPAIDIEGLSYAYNGNPVLTEISLSIKPGEFVAIMGRNGSGKSTLVKHLIGLLRPNRGRVRLVDRDIADQDVQEIARYVGYVPQNPTSLLFAETVYEELLVTLRNHGLHEQDAPLDPGRLLAHLGLEQVAHRYPRDLSAGQRERVALAAVLVTRPPVILLDEPTRGLDYRQKRSLMEQLADWRADGATILIVSHDVELIAAYAERVILLADGRIAVDGPTSQVLGDALAFAPQMTRLFGRRDLLTVEDVMHALPPQTATDLSDRT